MKFYDIILQIETWNSSQHRRLSLSGKSRSFQSQALAIKLYGVMIGQNVPLSQSRIIIRLRANWKLRIFVCSGSCIGQLGDISVLLLQYTYRWIPDIVHYKLDSVLVLLWPRLCNVDQSLEQHSTVSYHVEIQFPPEENNLVKTVQGSLTATETNLVKMTADFSMTSACLYCLVRSLATGDPCVPVPPHRIRMNFIPFYKIYYYYIILLYYIFY